MAAVSVAVLLGMEPASASSLYSWGYMGPLMPRDFGVERRRALEFARPQRPVPQRKNLEARTPKNNFKPKNVAVRNLPTKNTTKNTSKSAIQIGASSQFGIFHAQQITDPQIIN